MVVQLSFLFLPPLRCTFLVFTDTGIACKVLHATVYSEPLCLGFRLIGADLIVFYSFPLTRPRSFTLAGFADTRIASV